MEIIEQNDWCGEQHRLDNSVFNMANDSDHACQIGEMSKVQCHNDAFKNMKHLLKNQCYTKHAAYCRMIEESEEAPNINGNSSKRIDNCFH